MTVKARLTPNSAQLSQSESARSGVPSNPVPTESVGARRFELGCARARRMSTTGRLHEARPQRGYRDEGLRSELLHFRRLVLQLLAAEMRRHGLVSEPTGQELEIERAAEHATRSSR
jgi:hypothetical protein